MVNLRMPTVKTQLAERMRMIERAERVFLQRNWAVIQIAESEVLKLIREEFGCSMVQAWEAVRIGFGNAKNKLYGHSPDGRWTEF